MQFAVQNRSDFGNATTANAGVDLKRNLELAADATRKQLGELVLQAVRAHDKFATTAFAAKYSSPMFSRYDAGMYYDFHSDAAIMNMGSHNPVRAWPPCSGFKAMSARPPSAMC
ncbi:MAG: hypothetical protein V3T62_03305 [Alphaproteobacteria bacterium]